jgi:chitin disaccharide deacetylase
VITRTTTTPAARQGLGSTSTRVGLIVNADDWGRDRETTDHIRACVACGSVTATSAMVFMQDSERSAEIAGECDVDVGLHLNFTTEFSSPNCQASLLEHQRRIATHLKGLKSILFHPGLSNSFDYVVQSQLEEFNRLYGYQARRIDGHHHMHLCANVVYGNLLPERTLVRRNFSFRRGEKSLANRMYRRFIDSRLSTRHPMVDFLFSLRPLTPSSRLERIVALACQAVVEVETHPVNADEYKFLTESETLQQSKVSLRQGFASLLDDRCFRSLPANPATAH